MQFSLGRDVKIYAYLGSCFRVTHGLFDTVTLVLNISFNFFIVTLLDLFSKNLICTKVKLIELCLVLNINLSACQVNVVCMIPRPPSF